LVGELVLLAKEKKSKRRMKTMGKSIWPLIAEFSYESDKVKYSTNIVAKMFVVQDKMCDDHPGLRQCKEDQKCRVCSKQLSSIPKRIFSLYAKPSLNIMADRILADCTLCTWKSKPGRFGEEVVAYLFEFQDLADCLSYINKNEPKMKSLEAAGIKASMKIHEVSEESLVATYDKSIKNKMIKNI
jgi:hypothetical protein